MARNIIERLARYFPSVKQKGSKRTTFMIQRMIQVNENDKEIDVVAKIRNAMADLAMLSDYWLSRAITYRP